LVTLPKYFWTRVLGSVVIQLYAGECTSSVDRALINSKVISLSLKISTFAVNFQISFHKKLMLQCKSQHLMLLLCSGYSKKKMFKSVFLFQTTTHKM